MQSLISLLISLSLLSSSISAAAVDKPAASESLQNVASGSEKEAPLKEPKAGATNSEAVSNKNTKFNGIEVPPMKEINGTTMDKDISDGYWYIKHYSPYCHHCKEVAPAWQTLYEFYYTSKPVPGKSGDQDSMNSFTRYYDFHFASLDCIAYGDACNKHEVAAYPMFSIHKNGVLVKKEDGGKDIKGLSDFAEGVLETIKPGSRSKDMKLPKVGASSVDEEKPSVSTEKSEKSEILKTEKTDVDEKVKDTAGAGGKGEKAATKPSTEKEGTTLDKLAGKTDEKQKTTEKIIPPSNVGIEKAVEEKFEKEEPKGKTKIDTADPSTASLDPAEVRKNRYTYKNKKPRPKPPKKQSGPPNPTGNSLSLTQETFQKLVTNTQDPWFVKFYAPWCHHCQALAPSWLQMAKELQNKLNIGEVNCDVESRLCKDVHVKAYPTIHFFRGGERVEYDGLRGLGDLVNFAKKALDVGQGVPTVDLDAFKAMEETEEVIFIYFYDHATTTEDFESLERLTLSLVGHAKLVKTNDTAMADRFKISTWPRLIVSRSGRASVYEALAPKDMRDFRQVLTWMQKVWLPIVPELTASNSRDIMKNHYVVLGILNREKADEFELDKREMRNAALEWMEKQTQKFELQRQELRDAKQLRLEEAEDRNDEGAKRRAKQIHIDIREDDEKQVAFAWVDGIFWERWIRTTYGVNVRDGERVVINDEDNHRFWDTTISGASITPSRTSILETIPKVIAPSPTISSKSTTGFLQRIFFSFSSLLTTHPILSAIFLTATSVLAYVNRGRLGRGGAAGVGAVGRGFRERAFSFEGVMGRRSRGFSLPSVGAGVGVGSGGGRGSGAGRAGKGGGGGGGFLGLDEKTVGWMGGGGGSAGNGKAD